MKATAQMVLVFGMFLSPAQVIAASCSSYYISEITLVSPGDTEAGRVQTFVGFGASKEEAEKNALGSCSHIQLDLETCLNSDRMLGRNDLSDLSHNSLHLKYMKAVKRVTGCSSQWLPRAKSKGHGNYCKAHKSQELALTKLAVDTQASERPPVRKSMIGS